MDTDKIKELATKYRLQPKSWRVQAYALFERGLTHKDIESQGLLPQLRPSMIYGYYTEWVRIYKKQGGGNA